MGSSCIPLRSGHDPPAVDAPRVLAWTLVASGCGGAVAGESVLARSDGGSMSAASTTLDGSPMTAGSEASAGTSCPVGVDAGPAVDTNGDGSSCMILASNYDQSCTGDSDCLAVWSGDFCVPGCECPNSVISYSARAQYIADVNATSSVGITGFPVCGCCAVELPPCCRQGICQWHDECSPPADTLDACTAAGGTCLYPDPTSPVLALLLIGSTSFDLGPPNSCAYADETCVIPLGPDGGAR